MPKLIVVSSIYAGDGKTTLSEILVNQLHKMGLRRGVVIDLDPQARLSRLLSQGEPSSLLSEALEDTDSSASFFVDTKYENVRLLAADPRLIEKQEAKYRPRLTEILEALKQSSVDFIVVDTPPILPHAAGRPKNYLVEAALTISDIVYMPDSFRLAKDDIENYFGDYNYEVVNPRDM